MSSTAEDVAFTPLMCHLLLPVKVVAKCRAPWRGPQPHRLHKLLSPWDLLYGVIDHEWRHEGVGA